MNFGRITGTVVCSQKLPGFDGEKLLLVQPLDENLQPKGRALVATDVVQAGPGDLVFFETGREAAIALQDPWNVSDATVMAIVDAVNREERK